ncbi:MAG TPA: CBS domain-containing protein [Myxococcaceae bacterium]|jgi:CBS domain-containing protein
MATHDPKSRLDEGSTNTPPYSAPNGVTEQRGNLGGTASPGSDVRSDVRRPEESPGEKIGRFFRKAMDRLSGHDEDEWRRGNERNERDPDTQGRYREGDPSWQYGRSALREGDPGEWSDLGRSRDDRNPSDERLQRGNVGPGQVGAGGRPSWQGSDDRQQWQPGRQSQGASSQQGPSFENRGQRTMGRPGASSGVGEGLGERGQPGIQRGEGDVGRDEWNRGDWPRDHRGDRSAQSGASGMSRGYAGSGASFGFTRDEPRIRDRGEVARDRDVGQGRRFWQREPLAARDVMTRNPRTVTRQSAIREAAVFMRDENCGVVPVVDGAGRLEGILTDRDIVVRGVSHESFVQLRVEQVMTDDVSAVTEDEPLTSVLDLMGRKQIRRVPVVDRDDRLLGIISMADIANRADYDEDLQDAFERISSRRSFWSLFS